MKPFERRTIWLRLGVTVELDNEEDERGMLSRPDGDYIFNNVLGRLIRNGKFTVDGESYIPASIITEYNKENGTAYDDSDDLYYLM